MNTTSNNELMTELLKECCHNLPVFPGCYVNYEQLYADYNNSLINSGFEAIDEAEFEKLVNSVSAKTRVALDFVHNDETFKAIRIPGFIPYGLTKLGAIKFKINTEGKTCFDVLSAQAGIVVSQIDVDKYVESEDFAIEYLDANGRITNREDSSQLQFKTPWKNNRSGKIIYGIFQRDKAGSLNFFGVRWGDSVAIKDIDLSRYGSIIPDTWEDLRRLASCENLSKETINEHLTLVEYLNGAGYKEKDGKSVTLEYAKFVRLSTNLKTTEGESIYGWFTKNAKGRFEGIDWGVNTDFREAKKQREKCYVGRLIFDSYEQCELFLDEIVKKTIKEPWDYRVHRDGTYKYPILKSYLEYELSRLYHETEVLGRPGKFIYNDKRTKVLYNTNLIDKFGHDLIFIGNLVVISGREYVSSPSIAPSRVVLQKEGFQEFVPMPPVFFETLDEIMYHGEWDMDMDISSYEHIIEQRIERFPEQYREENVDVLGDKLDHAISFARKIAQRNYKFIVPMYYPSKNRIQLLMPIYLNASYSSHPDFALVLTPRPDLKTPMYELETILGLDEVYQDARLLAKPGEPWLNSITERTYDDDEE